MTKKEYIYLLKKINPDCVSIQFVEQFLLYDYFMNKSSHFPVFLRSMVKIQAPDFSDA